MGRRAILKYESTAFNIACNLETEVLEVNYNKRDSSVEYEKKQN